MKSKNYDAASLLEKLAENRESALKHELHGSKGDAELSLKIVNSYLMDTSDNSKHRKPNVQQVMGIFCTFFSIWEVVSSLLCMLSCKK